MMFSTNFFLPLLLSCLVECRTLISDPHGVPLFFRDRSRFAGISALDTAGTLPLESRVNDDDEFNIDDSTSAEFNEPNKIRFIKVPLISVEDITRNLTGGFSFLDRKEATKAPPARSSEDSEYSNSEDYESKSESDSDYKSDSTSLEDFFQVVQENLQERKTTTTSYLEAKEIDQITIITTTISSYEEEKTTSYYDEEKMETTTLPDVGEEATTLVESLLTENVNQVESETTTMPFDLVEAQTTEDQSITRKNLEDSESPPVVRSSKSFREIARDWLNAIWIF